MRAGPEMPAQIPVFISVIEKNFETMASITAFVTTKLDGREG